MGAVKTRTVNISARDFVKVMRSAVFTRHQQTYASDFTLYEVGSFNSDSGMFESLSDIRLVIEGSTLKSADVS
jgi:hypothetical protein